MSNQEQTVLNSYAHHFAPTTASTASQFWSMPEYTTPLQKPLFGITYKRTIGSTLQISALQIQPQQSFRTSQFKDVANLEAPGIHFYIDFQNSATTCCCKHEYSNPSLVPEIQQYNFENGTNTVKRDWFKRRPYLRYQLRRGSRTSANSLSRTNVQFHIYLNATWKPSNLTRRTGTWWFHDANPKIICTETTSQPEEGLENKLRRCERKTWNGAVFKVVLPAR